MEGMLTGVVHPEGLDRHTHDYMVVTDRTLLHPFSFVCDFDASARHLVVLEEETHNILLEQGLRLFLQIGLIG